VSKALNIAVNPPIPSARVAIATAENAGLRRTWRSAYWTSRASCSRRIQPQAARTSSFTSTGLPNARRAAYGSESSASSSRWLRISRSKSRSLRARDQGP